MIEIKHNYSLKKLNTFGVSAFAKAYTSINTIKQLKECLGYYHNRAILVISGGSNMLIVNDIQRPVLHLQLKGIAQETVEGPYVYVTAQAGENWHELVKYCIKNQLGGLENLSLIPGNVGTAPIQNIGAYGVEIKDVMHRCTAIDRETLEEKSFDAAQCSFGYRDSIFKNEGKDRYVITSVTFKLENLLHKEASYQLKTSYGAIKQELERLDLQPTVANVSQAVINIRRSKLPDPALIGNSGSFFKNPIVDIAFFEDLKRMHPEIPSYPAGEDRVKIPAGWLIEHSGLKGSRDGDAGVHDRQALVIVNHGSATGAQLLSMAQKVQYAVLQRYGIELEMEVNIIKG